MSENVSEPDKMQLKLNSGDKQPKNGDEQLQTMSVDKIDPAILVVRDSVVRYKYSKTQLMELREAPISRNKPTFLDVNDITPSILDPEKWNLERKKSDTPTENGSKAGDRRPNDPRERVRKENDGIVLSPQRRSFNSGCFVPVRETSRSNRSHSPLGAKNDSSLMKAMGRDVGQSGARRIGSGRILRDWDITDRPSDGDEYGFGRGPSKGDDRRSGSDDKYDRRSGSDDKYDRRGGSDDKYDRRGGGDDKYERRSFGREFDGGKEKEGGKKNGRYSERRKYSESRIEDEPEWFSGGPLSQNDTIELRGFDDADKPVQKKKLSPSRVKRAKEWSKKKNESQTSIAEEEENEERPKEAAAAAGGQGGSSEQKGNNEKPNPAENAETRAQDQGFNFDDIMKCDTIPGLLTNGISGDGDAPKSRFSRWFTKESPERGAVDGRRPSAHEENHVIKDLLRDFTEPSVSIPGDYEAYFAPISPAANTGNASKPSGRPINIVEMLQRGKQGGGGGGEGMLLKQPPMTGKILSLDELEAKIRQNAEPNMHPKPPQQKPDEEMTAAFKRLLAQAGSHSVPHNGPMPKAQPMSLLEMLSHSQQQEEAARMMGQNMMGGNPTGMSGLAQHAHNLNSVSELTLKLQAAQQAQQQQKQMEMLNKLINGGVHTQQASPLHDMGIQQSRDLLNRPEAQAILQGLKRGEITTQHLYQQLANPALQPRHRDMLVTILKLQGSNGNNAGYGPSPRVLSPAPPPPQFYQQQQLRVSPLPPNAYCVSPIMATSPNTLAVPAMHQRIPSPRELQVHTQNILQRALIKKKLEEQTENYRKKQEMQRGSSPASAAKSVSSPTPLAFTPTSVLRKMTADKDDGKENRDGPKPPGRAVTGMKPQQPQAAQQPQQPIGQPQWAQQFGVKQPGRPIVKANNFPSAQSQTAEQFFREQQQQQQQRLFGGQQPAQQQRKPAVQYPIGQGSGMPQGSPYQGNPYSGQQFSQQLTQQQMRAQHQHRPVNQQQGGQQQQQGGYQQNQQQQGGSTWQQFISSTQNNNRAPGARPTEDSLSPTTSDQLARWFSPDLLERARGGELPSTAGLPQHVLSLEEIERQTAPPVHN